MDFWDKHQEGLTKAATILSKLLEIVYDIGAVAMVVALVMVAIDPVVPIQLVQGGVAPNEELTVQGFSLVCGSPDGTLNRPALILFLLGGALLLALMGWVFRNTNLILRTTQGLTKFSQGKTPFQKDNVRMLREIGLFFLSMTVVKFVLSVIATMLIGPELAEVSVDFGDAVIGLLMLCLSQCFAIGMRMQQDMDGLV